MAAEPINETLPTISIAAGSTSGTKTISVNPTQDIIDEGAGEFIRLTGTHAGVTPALTVNHVDLTIGGGDATPTHVDLSASLSRTSLREDDTTAATVTASARLQGDSTRTVDTVVSLNSTLGGTATAGTGKDYTHGAGRLKHHHTQGTVRRQRDRDLRRDAAAGHRIRGH